MKKLTRCLSLVGLAAISVGTVSVLASCDKREDFVIWCASEAVDTTTQLVDEFIEANPEFGDTYKVTINVQGEGDAATNVITDVTSAADVYFFAQDQIARLVQVGGLSSVPSSTRSDVIARNDEGSVEAATVGDVIRAYPATSDNGYIVYYDKSVPGLEAEMTREGGARQSELIKIAQQNTRQIDFELTDSGWYLASYFMATECESTWITDDNGKYINKVDDWNSAAGLSAIQGAAELIKSGVFINNSDASVAFNGNAMLIVDGTWDSSTAKNLLGSNFGVAPLWTFDIIGDSENSVEEGETETFQLGCFQGYKLVGVKPNDDGVKNNWAHRVANYLTDEHAQTLRHEELGWGPSNVKAQATEAVLGDEILQALNEQYELCSVVQGQYPNAWWTITVTLGSKIASLSSDYSNDDLWALLKEYEEGADDILTAVSGDYAITGNLGDGDPWAVNPVLGASKYCLYEDNADTGTYSVGSDGVVHGKWTVDLELVGGGCYVDTTTEVGLVRVTDWGEWTGNWGYKQLTNTTGYYDWNSETYGGGTDNNIGALPGSYTFVFDYTGSTPAITMTAK